MRAASLGTDPQSGAKPGAPRRLQVTYLPGHTRHGMLANVALAARAVCVRPEQVLLTLDGDDCLLGADALQLIHDAHVKVCPLIARAIPSKDVMLA